MFSFKSTCIIESHWGLIQISKEKTQELKTIHLKIIKLREDLRNEINKKIQL